MPNSSERILISSCHTCRIQVYENEPTYIPFVSILGSVFQFSVDRYRMRKRSNKA